MLSHIAFAQCDKKTTFTISTGRDFQKNGDLNEERPIDGVVSFTPDRIILKMALAGKPETAGVLEAEIVSVPLCEWKTYLGDGRARYNTWFIKENTPKQWALVDLESKKGRTMITVSFPDVGWRFQVDVADYHLD